MRAVAGDSELAEAVKITARAHQTLVWDRTRQVQRLRAALLESFPAAVAVFDDLTAGHPRRSRAAAAPESRRSHAGVTPARPCHPLQVHTGVDANTQY